MYLHPSVTINARYNEIYLQYVYYNLLAHMLFSTSSYVLVSVLYKNLVHRHQKDLVFLIDYFGSESLCFFQVAYLSPDLSYLVLK